MSVKFSEIVTACTKTDAKRDYINSFKNDCIIKRYEFLTKEESSFDPDCVYIGMASSLPAKLPDSPFMNLIVIKDDKLRQQYIDSVRVNVVLLPHSTDVFWLTNKIHSFFVANEYVCDCINELLETASDSTSYMGILSKAFEVFGNPIMVTDLSLNVIESTIGVGGTTKDEFWKLAIKPGAH